MLGRRRKHRRAEDSGVVAFDLNGDPRPLSLYAAEAVREAKIEELEDGEGLYGFIPGFDGVWATAQDEATLLRELETVVSEWAVLKVADRDYDLPSAGGLRVGWH